MYARVSERERGAERRRHGGTETKRHGGEVDERAWTGKIKSTGSKGGSKEEDGGSDVVRVQ